MPVALGALEGFAGVPGEVPSVPMGHPRRANDEITLDALHPSGATIDMLWASTNGSALQHVCIGRGGHELWVGCERAVIRHH